MESEKQELKVKMVLDRKLGFDRATLDNKVLAEDDESIVFPAIIAREIIQPYPDGIGYKPADELEKAAWTAEGRWVTTGKHPDTQIIMRRDDVKGRVENVKYVKDLIDPKTRRPNGRGIRSDLRFYKHSLTAGLLDEIRSGAKKDVSIGFLYDQDDTPGTWNGDKYDFVQRNIFIDHVAAAVPMGRCPSPFCGIGADSIGRKIGLDPYSGVEDLPEAVKKLPEKAQQIFLATVNNALKEYNGDEEKAFAVAWAAVKTKYEKNSAGEWTAKKEGDTLTVEGIQKKINELYDRRDLVQAKEKSFFSAKQEVDPEVKTLWREIEDIDIEIRAYKDLKAKQIVEGNVPEGDCPICDEITRLGSLEFTTRLVKRFGKDIVLDAIHDQVEEEPVSEEIENKCSGCSSYVEGKCGETGDEQPSDHVCSIDKYVAKKVEEQPAEDVLHRWRNTVKHLEADV